ncbi:Myb-like DNA-binding domain containing protein [Tritrichomonas foetus]|uniref:Myb-like DNA-binding domain containing protein n=1 Tax=Tritrichomonas foetus TaxID=1144522 RepID=A0A1J4KWX5_9EUKA|nr:Myb-like DNA-binding domain containing protein [Tritrichomonas foetus]|eukprot:OHT14045.1 Myb-like DNA-binding domain containing protein [Tritrichomonas foetus]
MKSKFIIIENVLLRSIFCHIISKIILTNSIMITELPSINELPLTEYEMLFFSKQSLLLPEFNVKGVWTKSEDDILKDAVSNAGDPIDWTYVASKVQHRTWKQCKERWCLRLHPNLKKIPFEKWEDDVVIKEREKYGNHWALIAKKLPGRTAVAVKNRWYSVLRHKFETVEEIMKASKPKSQLKKVGPYKKNAAVIKEF